MNKNNTSGYKGVFYRKVNGNWFVRIKHRGIQYSLGDYKTKEEGACAYNNFVIKNNTKHELNRINNYGGNNQCNTGP